MKLGAIGECMLEISHTEKNDNDSTKMTASIGFGGDTLNTLIYASRLGIECFFYSALGIDPYSDWLLSNWQSEKINTRFVQRLANKLPGIYTIQLAPNGERQFLYWRRESAAQDYLNSIQEDVLLDQFAHLDVVYLSGITLGIFDDLQRERLVSVIQKLKLSGKTIVFDGNYRSNNWESTLHARKWINQLLQYVDWYLPTLDDEKSLFGVESLQQLIVLHSKHHIKELVVKDGVNGCWLINQDGVTNNMPVMKKISPLDTTAAGDSFNAGYIAARLHGLTSAEAANIGHEIAAQVIQHHGAIIPIAEFKKIEMNK